MCCTTARRGKRRSFEAGMPTVQVAPQAKPPPGCSAASLDMALGGIRRRLDAVSHGTLRNPKAEVPRLVESVRRTTEWLMWGERHDPSLFDLFCEHSILSGFVTVLRVRASPKTVKLQVLQSLSILVQNVSRATSLIYLLSGGLLNTFFDYPPDLDDEEMLAYFVTLLKGLVLRLDEDLALLCLVSREATSEDNDEVVLAGDASSTKTEEAAQCLPIQKRMPIFERSVHLIGHIDPMVDAAASTAVLCILRLKQPAVRAAGVEASLRLLAPRLADFGAARVSDAAGENSDCMESLVGFVADIYRLDLPEIRAALEFRGFIMDSSGVVVLNGNQTSSAEVSISNSSE